MYKIIPVSPVAGIVDAESPESALEGFAWAMDDDMNTYFKAVPVIVEEAGDNQYFGIVRWCDVDIANKLVEMGIEPTQDHISSVRCECENNHHFTDTMVEAGWMSIENAIAASGIG